LRSYDDETRTAMLNAIRRIVAAECAASGCEQDPEVQMYDRFPVTDNDHATTARVAEAFTGFFGDRAVPIPQIPASEDFAEIPAALGVPYTYWAIGGTDPGRFAAAEQAGRLYQDIPVNHSAAFAPVVQPTLDTGTQALVVAALAWL
jgi:metal-dependent amidase/aminoacylase/carboxypeptidase family protein